MWLAMIFFTDAYNWTISANRTWTEYMEAKKLSRAQKIDGKKLPRVSAQRLLHISELTEKAT
jgi:hypothetical protein